MSYWSLSMGVKERNLKRLNGDLLRSRDLYARDGEGIRCGFVFGSSRSMGRGQPPPSYNPPWNVPTCLPQKDGKRQNGMSAEAVWQQMPQLNPEADISTIQLVQPKTSQEELLDIYLEVYKLCTGYPAPHQENWPFWRRYQLPSLATQWRKKTILMLQNSLIPTTFIHPGADHLDVRESLLDRSLARVCRSTSESFVGCCNLRRGDRKTILNEGLFWYRMET